jgi:hypothetical protein
VYRRSTELFCREPGTLRAEEFTVYAGATVVSGANVLSAENCAPVVPACSAEVLSSEPDIQDLRSLINRSQRHSDILFDPAFYLASLTTGWVPRVVVVRRGSEFAGVVYAKERVLSGRRLGIVYADLTFGSILAGNPIDYADTVRFALTTLLGHPGIRGVRLRVLRSSPELTAVRKLLALTRLDTHFSRVYDHAVLSLPRTYEQLLLSFGSTTRRNFRYYRRRCEAAGHVYVENIPLSDLRSAAGDLEAKCSKPCRPGAVDRVINMTATAERPLAVGLRDRDGDWLSIICGVYRPAAGVILLQLNNDRDFGDFSLSTVLRGYLIETLIHQRMNEFIIWAGTAPPLSRYVQYIPTVAIHLDSSAFWWRLVRLSASTLGPWLPKKLRPDARWVAPF